MEKEKATHSSVLAWRTPWREEPGGLQPMGSQTVGHNTRLYSHWSQWPSFKNLQITNAGEGVERREPSYSAGENVS